MNVKIVLLCLLPWLVLDSAQAQVKVSVLLDQEQFLPGEAVPVKVRIINHSGQTLHLGEDDRWLRLSVMAEESFVVERNGEVPVTGRFELPPSKMATKEVDLAPYFVLSRPGRYSVVASVWITEWNQTLTSPPSSFDIIQGTKLWERTFGVPNSARPGGAPEVRKYLLQQANHLRTQIVLYARITSADEEHTLKVVPIGPMVSFSEPRALLDKASNLHVLYQSGPRISTYFALTPEGEVLARDKYEYSGTRPRLAAAEDGTVNVKGGIKMPTAADSEPDGDSIHQQHNDG